MRDERRETRDESVDVDVDVEIEADAWLTNLPGCDQLVSQAVIAAVAASSPVPRLSSPAPSVSVLLTDDAEVRALNRDHRRQDKATNVLSFPAHATAVGHLGDIALAFETCAAEAEAQGKPLANHLRHLVVHGVLHLLGEDHADDDEAEAMEQREREILASLGVPDPYLTTP